jgi:hypothetical protein
MTQAIKRTFSMRPEVDRLLAAHVEHTSDTFSSTVNNALMAYLESAALRSYAEWDAAAPPDERSALDAFAAHDDATWPLG